MSSLADLFTLPFKSLEFFPLSFIKDNENKATFNASSSGVKPGLYSPCQRKCSAHSKYDVNIEEMIEGVGLGFHAKVK